MIIFSKVARITYCSIVILAAAAAFFTSINCSGVNAILQPFALGLGLSGVLRLVSISFTVSMALVTCFLLCVSIESGTAYVFGAPI